MKRILFYILLFGTALRAHAVDYTDIWFNPAQPGYGFNIVESDDGTGAPFLFVTFFVYGPSGTPTWYTAQLKWNSIDAFTGNVFSTAGTFFGSPWVAGNLSVLQAGTASFKPNLTNNYEGTLSYTITGGATSTSALTRQTLTSIATSGNYIGGQIGTFSTCNTASSNGPYTDYYSLQVTQAANGNVKFDFKYKSGLSCLLTGRYSQNGQYFTVLNAAYTCSDGTSTNAQMSEIKATALGLEGRLAATGGLDNCKESAFFGGPRSP